MSILHNLGDALTLTNELIFISLSLLYRNTLIKIEISDVLRDELYINIYIYIYIYINIYMYIY